MLVKFWKNMFNKHKKIITFYKSQLFFHIFCNNHHQNLTMFVGISFKLKNNDLLQLILSRNWFVHHRNSTKFYIELQLWIRSCSLFGSKALEILNQNGEAKSGKQCSSVSEFDVYGVKSGLEIESRKTEKKKIIHTFYGLISLWSFLHFSLAARLKPDV